MQHYCDLIEGLKLECVQFIPVNVPQIPWETIVIPRSYRGIYEVVPTLDDYDVDLLKRWLNDITCVPVRDLIGLQSALSVVLKFPVKYRLLLSYQKKFEKPNLMFMLVDQILTKIEKENIKVYPPMLVCKEQVEDFKEKLDKLETTALEVDKSDPNTYWDRSKAIRYAKDNTDARVADLISILYCFGRRFKIRMCTIHSSECSTDTLGNNSNS